MRKLVHEQAKKVVVNLREEIRLDNLVHLPAIIVGNDTSSGKSTLLTAISGLDFPSKAGLTTKCLTEVILLAMAAERDDIQAALTALAQVEGIKFIPLFDELELGAHLRPASSLEADQCKPGIASTSRDKEERGNMGNRLSSLTRAIWLRSDNTNEKATREAMGQMCDAVFRS